MSTCIKKYVLESVSNHKICTNSIVPVTPRSSYVKTLTSYADHQFSLEVWYNYLLHEINILKNISLGTVPENVIILQEQFLCQS